MVAWNCWTNYQPQNKLRLSRHGVHRSDFGAVFLALVPVFILSNYWSKRRYRPPRKQALQKASIGAGMLVLAR